MNLIIDFGNTKTKIALFNCNKIIETLITDDARNATLLELMRLKERYPFIKQCIISSVTEYPRDVENLLSNWVKNDVVLKLDSNTPIPIDNLYASKHSLGYDRIAAAVGANNIFPDTDVLIIDAGTAITFDFVNRKNQYVGGNISPGMQMRFNALHAFTKRLPLLKHTDLELLISTNTNEAICSGVQKGLIFEIEGYINDFHKKYDNLKTIFTGGDTFFFERKLKNIIFAEPNLVLRGLNTILNFNQRN